MKKNLIFHILDEEANRRITYAVAQIEPIGYHEKISPILECDPETALLVLKQMHFDEMDEPVLFSVNYFKADKFSFQGIKEKNSNIFLAFMKTQQLALIIFY